MSSIGTVRRLVAPAAMALVAGLAASAAHAVDTFNVYTGYADNLRPSGFFPTVWLGDPGVVSETPFGQSSDSGAVRIQNTGATTITITNFTVSMNGGDGSAVYAIWGPLTIAPGQNGIFTQTGSYNFDSSDNSTGGPAGTLPNGSGAGSNGIGGCSSTAAVIAAAGETAYCNGRQPIVSFLENGVLFTLNDTGHILDTGNYDFINGSPDGNESINWNNIGSEANRGGSVPEPSTWAMLILGVGLVGLTARRRRAVAIA